MSLDIIISERVDEDDLSYNVKWTLLSHIRQIAKSDTFRRQFDKDLPDSSFIDSTPFEWGVDPVFGVEYMGVREQVGGSFESVGLYIISFRGASQPLQPLNEFGIDSRSRRLLFLHDSMKLNLKNRGEGSTGLTVLNFRNKDNTPTPIAPEKTITLVFLESSFPLAEQSTRRLEGFDLVYNVIER
jgi:hypothetical protein